MEYFDINLPITVAWIINWLILAGVVVVACFVGRDGRRRGLPLSRSIGWFLLTLFLFPIGIALYLLVGRPEPPKTEDKEVFG